MTAKNKSRSADEVSVVVSLLGRRVETSKLSSNTNVISANTEALATLLSVLGAQPQSHGPLIWRDFSRRVVVDFLTTFRAHPSEELWFGNSLRDYVRDTDWARLDKWDIVLMQGAGQPFTLQGQNFSSVTRAIRRGEKDKLMVSGKSARLAGATDVRGLVDAARGDRIAQDFNDRRELLEGKGPTNSVPEELFYEALTAPLLMLYPLTPSNPDGEFASAGWRKQVVVGAKVALPGHADLKSKNNHGDVKYLINKVAQRAWSASDYSVDEKQENDD